MATKKEPKSADYYEELVDVELFYDGDRYKDDVVVSVNGETIQIKRGQKVKIKRKFAEVLEKAQAQAAAAADLKRREQQKFDTKRKQLE